jgi:hypothetical protein
MEADDEGVVVLEEELEEFMEKEGVLEAGMGLANEKDEEDEGELAEDARLEDEAAQTLRLAGREPCAETSASAVKAQGEVKDFTVLRSISTSLCKLPNL